MSEVILRLTSIFFCLKLQTKLKTLEKKTKLSKFTKFSFAGPYEAETKNRVLFMTKTVYDAIS